MWRYSLYAVIHSTNTGFVHFNNGNTFRSGNGIVVRKLVTSLMKTACFVFPTKLMNLQIYTIFFILFLLMTSDICLRVNQEGQKWNMQQWQTANQGNPQSDQTCDLGLISTLLNASELMIHRLIGPDHLSQLVFKFLLT